MSNEHRLVHALGLGTLVSLVACSGALGDRPVTGETGGNPGAAGSGGAATGEGSGTGGRGGDSGARGGDSGGRGGDSGGNGGSALPTTLTLPGCLQDLLAPCNPKGTCTYESFGATGITCFETGAHGAWGQTVEEPGACDPGTNIVPVSKADGTLCYQYEFRADATMDCRVIQHTWRDADGSVVASGTSGPGQAMIVTCRSTGERAICGVPDAVMGDGCCSVTFFGGAICPDGVINPSCSPGSCSTTGTAAPSP
jgi:hypothetical protein